MNSASNWGDFLCSVRILPSSKNVSASLSSLTPVVLFVLALLTILTSVPSAYALSQSDSYVVINSRDWRDMYLGTIYAGLTNQSVFSFANLAEVQVKSKIMPPSSKVTIIEPSKNPVVKKYAAYLSANGFSNTNTIDYTSYVDLQFKLLNKLETTPNQQIDGLAVMYAKYGVESVALSPRLVRSLSMPLFVEESTAEEFFIATEQIRKRPTIVAGHFPIRLLSKIQDTFSVSSLYVGETENNTASIVRDLTNSANTAEITGSASDAKMGVITRIDRVDLQSLTSGLPQFVYFGSAQDVANQIAASNIKIFEVISSDATNLAKTISGLSGKNLKLLVKYARGFTNVQGLTGQLLDLDTVEFPYPFTFVTVGNATYYPQESIVAVTLRNEGSVDALSYTTIEFDKSSYADEQPILIPSGSSVTTPYKVQRSANSNSISMQVVVNTLYGKSLPLTQTVVGANGEPLVILTAATNSNTDNSNISFVSSKIDESLGTITIDIKNNANSQVLVSTQIIQENKTVASSPPIALASLKSGRLNVPIPYLTAEQMTSKPLRLIFSYGEFDTINQLVVNVDAIPVVYAKESNYSLYLIAIAIVLAILIVVISIRYIRKKVA